MTLCFFGPSRCNVWTEAVRITAVTKTRFPRKVKTQKGTLTVKMWTPFFFLKGRCCFFVCVFFPIWPSHKLSHSYYATFKVFRSTTKFILWESYLLYFFLMSSTENTLVFITSYFEPSHFANNLELIQNIETRVWKGFTIWLYACWEIGSKR